MWDKQVCEEEPAVSSTEVSDIGEHIHKSQTHAQFADVVVVPLSIPKEKDFAERVLLGYIPSRQELKMVQEHFGDMVETQLKRQELYNAYKCLQHHEVTAERRAKVVDWMIKVCAFHGCHEQVFFKALNLMDLFYAKTTT